MESAKKLKWSIFIFNLLHCLSSGCEYNFNDCFYDVSCSNVDIDFGHQDFRNQYSECNYNTVYDRRDGIKKIPLRVKFESEYAVNAFLYNSNTDNNYNNLIVSLEMTDISLTITPSLNEMHKLIKLNLSNNQLEVAKLYNKAELTVLENIDLSHNIINSIKVDLNQFVYRNIRALNLSYNLLVNIPGEIFEPFKYLESLDLSHNLIFGIDNYSFEGSKNLKYLYLSHNNITDINTSLFRFNYLEELYLDNNKIENLPIQEFVSLISLRKLNLDFNKINAILKDTFSNTKSLVELKLQHNLISTIHKDAFVTTNRLQLIDLSDNLIQNLPQNLFINKTITSFSITGNNLKGAITKGMFEGLQLITELNVSYQAITAIDELAFYGFATLEKLLLNNNEIRTISEYSFKPLKSLKQLDLSNNMIVSVHFSKRDMVKLEILSLNNNFIKEILHDDFQGLSRLRVLDLSNNSISNIERNSFTDTAAVETLRLFNNPINGSLLSNSFVGLQLISILDLSYTLLICIQNESFSGLTSLQELDISRGFINKLEYEAFTNTGIIKSIDLSYNNLKDFYVNGTDLSNLTTLYLNNNAIFHISNYVFKHMGVLSKIILSHNLIESIDDECFKDQTDLLHLDVSFNNNLTFHMSTINHTQKLEKLILSGVKNIPYFIHTTIPIKQLELSHLSIRNISLLHLSSMVRLTTLVMSNNNIAQIELSALKNMNSLGRLDLSFNNITYIQPGAFKDNVLLRYLNLSHNLLTSLNYGIFRGLDDLNLLDISYNTIRDLGRKRLYDTKNLKVLIADYNRITDIDTTFFGIKLDLLSIGHNLLSCDNVISLKEHNSFVVRAINIDESHGDNIDGIACNMNKHNEIIDLRNHSLVLNTTMNDRILLDIRDILLNSSQNQELKMSADSNHSDLFNKIFNKLDKYDIGQTSQLNDIKSEIVQFKDIKSEVVSEVNKTNLFLDKILKAILGLGSLQNRFVGDSIYNATSNKDNLTYDQNNTYMVNHTKLDMLVSDVNQLKQGLLYMENIISEIDRKMSLERTLNTPSVFEKLNKSDHDNFNDNNASKSFIFMEVCVTLILLMLICFFLYKVYETKIFERTRSLSTRDIVHNMDNSNL